jgi:hypothetical protein
MSLHNFGEILGRGHLGISWLWVHHPLNMTHGYMLHRSIASKNAAMQQ